MKNIFFLFVIGAVLLSCEQTKKDREAMLPDSSGNINTLQVVIANDLWTGEVGESIREVFAAPIYGLPQEEPLFSIRQMPPDAFEGFAQINRNFLFVQKQNETHYKNATNYYAKPQTGYFLSAPDDTSLVELINKNGDEMVAAYQKTEIKEKQRRMSKSLLDVSPVTEKLGVSFKAPSVYRIAKLTDNFAWLRKDIRTGTTNLMIFEMPLNAFDNDETRVRDIIKMRDSIGKAHIEGPTKGSYMITENAFSPFIFETEIDGRFAYEAKATWEVKNDFMAGPFVCYIIKDEANQRILVMEGFTFAPSVAKRDYQFELEAIIRSVKIN